MSFQMNITDQYIKQMYQNKVGGGQEKAKGGKPAKGPEGGKPGDKAAVYEKGAQAAEKPATYQKPAAQDKQSDLQAKLSKTYEGLSDAAKDYLAQLKEKYGNIEFFVADCSSDEEMSQYFALGKKQYSCVISTETIERMATDESAREKYESIIAGAGDTFEEIREEMKQELGEEAASKIESFGMTIGEDGVVNYFAKLRESNDSYYTKQKERLAEKREAAKEEAERAKEKRREDGFGKQWGSLPPQPPYLGFPFGGGAMPMPPIPNGEKQEDTLIAGQRPETASSFISADSKEALFAALKERLVNTEG